MLRRTSASTVAAALLSTPLVLLALACSRQPEQQLLTQFFRAARGRDNETLARMSAVSFDPRTHGAVEDFDIVSVGEEQRRPLDFKSLMDAEAKAREAELAFTKEKLEYQSANREAIEELLKLERDPASKMSPAQMKLKAEWDKWRQDTSTYTKATASARAALAAQSGSVEASLSQPGQPAFTPEKFTGELLTKDVTVNAQVRGPDQQVTQKTLLLTMQRARGTLDGADREGRWIITSIQET